MFIGRERGGTRARGSGPAAQNGALRSGLDYYNVLVLRVRCGPALFRVQVLGFKPGFECPKPGLVLRVRCGPAPSALTVTLESRATQVLRVTCKISGHSALSVDGVYLLAALSAEGVRSRTRGGRVASAAA